MSLPEAHLRVAGRAVSIRCAGMTEPLRSWLGAAAQTAEPMAGAICVDVGPVPVAPGAPEYVHLEPLVEVRGDGDGGRWFASPQAMPTVWLDLREGRILCATEAADDQSGSQLRLLALALLGALRGRGLLPVHAGAVVYGGGAVLLLGPSGRGKSTATARLAGEGLEVIADDTVLLDGDTVHGLGEGIRMRAADGAGGWVRPVLSVPRHEAMPCRAVVVLDPPGDGGPQPLLVAEPHLDVYAALLDGTPMAMDPDSLNATRAGLRQLARLPAFRCSQGALDAPLRPALEIALGRGDA